MKYNKFKSVLCGSLLMLAGGVSITSCTDWLDKDPESIIAEDEAFKNYRNFQGYIEEIYDKIPNIINSNYSSSWNFGDDAVHNPEGWGHFTHHVDLGDYRDIWTNTQTYINGDRQKLWSNAWYCIRKCNMGIENINSLVGTDEEKAFLLGQMYFFRAWWHFELIKFFGGLPYVDVAFEAKIPELKRLSFQECADRCAADFEQAYNLLPMNWDETLVGMQTSSKNDLRVNKFMALCYLGKCYLYAGSPLMKEFEKTKNGGAAILLGASANGKTYDYDVKYCKLAAEALGKALNFIESDDKSVPYRLVDFKYSNMYDHERDENYETCYSDIFYTYKQNWKMPGSTEAIFRGVYPGVNVARWRFNESFGPKVGSLVGTENIIHQPTANLVDQYGMANGEPIYLVVDGKLQLNPDSGWDPEYPFQNRDPRFYHDIIFDGFRYVLDTDAMTTEQKKLLYTPLYTGGALRSVDNASSTGYFIQKLAPHQCNEFDKWYDWDGAMECYIPLMRLADVYLMYAEARAGMATTKTELGEKPSYCPSLSAIDAINVLRKRVSSDDYPMEGVAPKFKNDRNMFIDEVRRERAVELAFEGFRWNDLQRWLLLTEPPYTTKYSHEFERLQDDSWFATNDPKNAKVGNFHSQEIITRHFDARHYWLPLPDKDTYLYEGFPQNPGW